MATQLSEGIVIVNDDAVGVVPNSIKFSEGLGEQQQLPVSVGGGVTEQVFANNLESAFSRVSFEVRVTIDMIELLKTWKLAGNGNTVQFAAAADGRTLTRSFAQAALVSDYDVE
ncbi:MAG TPA: hypothetical protein VMX57_08465, partial [Planctomycetota bacterium]|nr:hypothetical protein [Planctomycetota bacterium]